MPFLLKRASLCQRVIGWKFQALSAVGVAPQRMTLAVLWISEFMSRGVARPSLTAEIRRPRVCTGTLLSRHTTHNRSFIPNWAPRRLDGVGVLIPVLAIVTGRRTACTSTLQAGVDLKAATAVMACVAWRLEGQSLLPHKARRG